MQLLTKTFLIKKGDNLDDISIVLKSEIGLDAYLIKDLQVENIADDYTRLTIVYQKYSSDFVETILPRKGGVYTAEIPSGSFYSSILFNTQIDPSTITEGVLLNGDLVPNISLIPDSNYYGYIVSLTGGTQSGFHDIRVDTSIVKKLDGSSLDYSPVAGYVIHSQPSSHLGDGLALYRNRIRGVVKAGVVRADKGVNLQSLLSETLKQKNIDSNSLLSFSKTKNNLTLELYFLYVEKEEPLILDGFPLNNTYIPSAYPPSKVTFVYNTKIDSSYLTQNNYYRIYSGYSNYSEVSYSNVTVYNDKRTVEIDVSSYISSPGLYSIYSPIGLKSYNGSIKYKPEQWNIYVDTYSLANITVSGGSGTGISTLNTSLGIEGSYSNGVLSLYLNGTFYTGITGHTGRSDIHFTQAEISIPSSQINNFNSSVTTILAGLSGDFVGHSGDYNNPHQVTAAQVGAPTISQFNNLSGSHTGHTGNYNNPHQVTASQVGAPTLSQFTALSGDHTGLVYDLGDLSNYVLVDGSRSFTSTIAGITPVSASDLATKSYVDSIISPAPLLENILQYSPSAATGDNYTLTGVSGIYLSTGASGFVEIGILSYMKPVDARDFTGNIVPSSNYAYDIGSQIAYLRNIYSNSGLFNTVYAESGVILSNNNWIKAKDLAGTGYVNIARINTSDELELNINLNFEELEFESTEVPATPTGESFKIYAYATGTSPSREITLYILDKQGKQIILTSLIE